MRSRRTRRLIEPQGAGAPKTTAVRGNPSPSRRRADILCLLLVSFPRAGSRAPEPTPGPGECAGAGGPPPLRRRAHSFLILTVYESLRGLVRASAIEPCSSEELTVRRFPLRETAPCRSKRFAFTASRFFFLPQLSRRRLDNFLANHESSFVNRFPLCWLL